MRRAWELYRLLFVQFFRRIYYSFATELVIGLCGAILVALFYYLFSDFLTAQVAPISLPMRAFLGSVLSVIVLAVAAIKLGLVLSSRQGGDETMPRVAERLGEEPRVLSIFYFLEIPSLFCLYYLPPLLLVRSGFVDWQLHQLSAAGIGMIPLSLLTWWGADKRARHTLSGRGNKKPRALLTRLYASPLTTMCVWRIKQMLFRDKSTALLLGLALVTALLNGYWTQQGAPLVMSVVLGYFTGLLSAAALILRGAADCRSLWIEKNCGVSHTLFLQTLQVLALIIASATALVQGLCLALPLLLTQEAACDGAMVIKVALISFSCPFLVPAFALQIDGRRSGVQLITSVLVGLLLTTAVFAHSLSSLLLPLVAYYGLTSQKDRFYHV
jgi:hypothetical protein